MKFNMRMVGTQRRIFLVASVVILITSMLALSYSAQGQTSPIVFDFLTSNGSGVAQISSGTPDHYGDWTSGVGWTTTCVTEVSGNNQAVVSIDVPISSTDVHTISINYEADAVVYFDITAGSTSYGGGFSPVIGAGTGSYITGPIDETVTSVHLQINAYAFVGADVHPDCQSVAAKFTGLQVNPVGYSTPTPTPSPTPPVVSGNPLSNLLVCGEPLKTDGIFNNFPGNWNVQGAAANPDGTNTGVLINHGQISTAVNIDGLQNYILDTHYHLTATGSPPNFIISIGTANPLVVNVNDTTDPQETKFPAAQYQPNDGTSLASISIVTTALVNTTLIIDSVCLTKESQTYKQVPPSESQVCSSISYVATGDLLQDIPNLFRYLILVITNIWQCVLYPLLLGAWQTVTNILGVISNIIDWVLGVVPEGAQWAANQALSLIYYVAGIGVNIGITVVNAILGLVRSLGIDVHTNDVLSFLQNFPTLFGQFFQNLPGIISAVVNFIGIILQIAFDFIGRIIHIIWSLIQSIPIIVSAIVNGFNAPANTQIPTWFPDCNNHTSLLFGPCLGAYVLDNTLWDGPIYYLIPIIAGFMALNTIVWAVEEFSDAMRQ